MRRLPAPGSLVWSRRGRHHRRVALVVRPARYRPRGWVLVRIYHESARRWGAPEWVPLADLLGPAPPSDRRVRAAMRAGGVNLLLGAR